MTAFNFRKRYVPLIEAGTKRQTIRKYRKDGRVAEPGSLLQLYYGMRTKQCRLLAEVTCASRAPVVVVIEDGVLRAWIDSGRVVNIGQFARDDGFEGADDMRMAFEQMHGHWMQGYLYRWDWPPLRVGAGVNA